MFSQQIAQALFIIFAQQRAQALLAGADVLKCVYTEKTLYYTLTLK